MEVVKFLIENGAQIDRADDRGFTPLWKASAVCLFCFFFFKKSKSFNMLFIGRSLESCQIFVGERRQT